jgi:hypothetical protein
MDKVQKHNSFNTNIPSSETYRNYHFRGPYHRQYRQEWILQNIFFLGARNCLTESALWAGALLCWRIQSLEVQAFSKHITVSSSKFGCTTTALILKCLYECTRFRTFQHIHRFCEILDDFFFHLLRPSLNRLRLPKTHDFFIAFSPYASESTAQVSLAFFPNFTQNLMLIGCSKNRSHVFATRRRKTISVRLLKS